MDDDDMTPEEFNRRLAAGEPAKIVVLRTNHFYTFDGGFVRQHPVSTAGFGTTIVRTFL